MWETFRTFPRAFWMVNIMEMFERLGYYGVRTVIPIYIAQADEIGGLHFSQTDKGVIFMIWALIQSLVPVFSGGFADRYGYKRTIATSITINIIGYILMATQRNFLPFLFGCSVLAFGTAIFKPGLQGTMVRSLTKENGSVGWGIFYMLVNIGGFLGPPLAHFLHGWSWPTVFYGCAAIYSLNYLMLFTYKNVDSGAEKRGGPIEIAKLTIRNIIKPRLFIFILVMSGFWLMFMQLFDMLPNFIVDWVDTSGIVAALNLPAMMTRETARGTMIAQEWMINIDAGLIVLCVVFISWLNAKMRRLYSILIGITIASMGLLLAGCSMSGVLCISGIIVFAVGEMLASPKMKEYLGVIAPPDKKALYMGYANMPLAIGWAYGSFVGGKVYDSMGDKANLALKYLSEHSGITSGVARTEAFATLQSTLNINATDATNLLWTTYHPYELWYIFVGIGMSSAVAILLYSFWVRKYETQDER